MKSVLIFLGGIVLGLALALFIGWELFPVEHYDAAPSSLQSNYKDEYLRLVSLTYQVEESHERALWRLEQLSPDEEASTEPLVLLTERWIAEDRPEAMVIPLIRMARDLGAGTPVMSEYMQRGTP